MDVLWTLACKDLRLLWRDKFALFWILAFPLGFSLFFGAIFGDDGGGGRGRIGLIVVDEDGGDTSAALIERLAGHDALRLPRSEDGALQGVDLEEARDAVRKGDWTAYLRIPAGFGDEPFAIFAGGGEAAGLELGIDPSRQAEAGLLQGVLMESVFAGLFERFTDKDAMRGQLADSLSALRAAPDDDLAPGQKLVLTTLFGALDSFFEQADFEAWDDAEGGGGFTLGGTGGGDLLTLHEVAREESGGPRSTFDVTLPSGMLWGLMSVAMSFAIMIVKERTEGTLLRLRVAPIGRAQLLGGKGLACFLTCLAVMTLLLAVGVTLLGLRVSNLPLLLLALACTAACFTGLSMTASVLGRSEQAVAGTSWGLMMPLAMVGGGMIPLIAMPDWLVTASHFSPFKWGILAIEGAIWRGFELGDMLLPCGILLGTGAAFAALGVGVLKRLDASA